MPMTFTPERVAERLKMRNLSTDGTEAEQRERLAVATETGEYADHVEAWEVRTGRPWNEMTGLEAVALIERHPELMGNFGVLSRLGK